jgi:hypothetical protein
VSRTEAVLSEWSEVTENSFLPRLDMKVDVEQFLVVVELIVRNFG